MEVRRERNVYNGSQLRPGRQAGASYHSKTSSNWHMFRNYKSNLSFSDSFSFKKSPRKKKKTEETDSLHRNSTLSFSKSCQATKENVEGCGVLKTNAKEDCQDLIFDKENDDLIFEGLTAVMKKAILDNPKVLEFITKVLPTYPGLATIMLPNQVIALYGSWSVIKQARQQLLNLSGLHEQEVSEPSIKENKSSSLITEESPPVLSPQKYNPHFPVFNKGPDKVTQSKSLSKEEILRNYTFSSSSSTVAAADSSSCSHNQKKCDETGTNPIQINSSDSDLSLPSLDGDPAEELDISAVVFRTTPLKTVARTGQMPFSSAVNGSVDSDSDSESVSITSSQSASRPKRTCTGAKDPGESGEQVNRLDKQKMKKRSVHVMKKRKGLAIWNGKSVRGKSPKKPTSYNTNRLLRKQPGRSVTAKRHDSGGGSEVEEEEEDEITADDDDEDEGEEDDDDDDDDDDDWATCAAASCSLKDRRDVTDIVWLQCEGCDTWWHCLCARLGDLTEDEASSLDFTCSHCLAPKTRQSAKRNKVS